MYHQLRKDLTFSFNRNLNEICAFSINLCFNDPMQLGSNVWKAMVVIVPFYKHCGFPNGFNFTSSHDDKKELKKYSLYQSPKTIDRLVRRQYNLSIILGENPEKESDLFLLNCRWLRYNYPKLNLSDQKHLWSKVGSKMDCRRKGGSNGTIENLDVEKLFKALSRPGLSPRQSHASMWILREKTMVLLYMGCISEARDLHGFTYSYPKKEGQVSLSKTFLENAPTKVFNLLRISAVIKYLTPYLIQSLNYKIVEHRGFDFVSHDRKHKNISKLGLSFVDRNVAITQDLVNRVGERAVETRVNNGNYKDIWQFLLMHCSVTCIADAVDVHIDKPKKNGFMPGNEGFVETRVLVAIDFLSAGDRADPPMGRGGGGPGVYVIALIDHQDSFRKRVGGQMNYRQFCRDQGIQLRVSEFFEVVNDPNHRQRTNRDMRNAIRVYNRMIT